MYTAAEPMFTPAELAVMKNFAVTPPAMTPQMLEYAHIRYTLLFVHPVYVVACLLLLLKTGWLTGARDTIDARIKKLRGRDLRYVLLASFLVFFQLLLSLLLLPYAYYSGFYIEHAFGLSDQPWYAWLGDFAKARAVGLVFMIAGWSAFFAVLRKRHWPLVLFAVLTPLLALSIFVYPLMIDPMFNKYAPVPAGALRSAVVDLAERAGVHDPAVFIADKSKQTKTMNAEVTGLGGSTRIVIWDTTLKLPQDQVLAIVGHELGHYKLGHIFWGFLLASGGLLIGLMIIGRYAEPFLKALPPAFGVRGLQDPMVVPVAMLLGSVLGFFFSPIDSAVSRVMEHQADAFGLRVTGNGPAMARAFVSLSNINLADPDPPGFIEFWFFGHPSLRRRIDFVLGITDS